MRRLDCRWVWLAGAVFAAAMVPQLAAAAEVAAQSAPAPLQQITSSADIVRMVQMWVSQNHVLLWAAYLAVAAPVLYGLYRFRTTELASKLRRTLEDEVLTNWRLTMLAITSLALTLASGWTTWDGMTNFTGTPILSFLITVGIQGVMLIAAWLIGESFAIGLAGSSGTSDWKMHDWLLAALSIALLAGALYALTMAVTYHGTIEAIDGMLRRHKSELALPIPTEQLRVLIALGVSGILTLLIVTQKDVFQPYFLGLKTILSSLPLWVMFLACMVTSVFFSFDSLFSTIFPQAERERAAQLRTTNQIAGIVADLGTTISKRQAENIDALISSPQWIEYSNRINDVINIARGAPEQIAAQARKELEDQQSQRAGIQERKATAESQQVRLDKRKEELLGDVNKLKEEVPPVVAEVDRFKGEIFQKDSEILTKKAEAQAEAGGVGGTLRAGQGPVWSARKKELDDLAKLKAILGSQLADRAAQLKEMRGKLAGAEAELAQIDGEIGKLKGEMDVADKQMATASVTSADGALTASTQSVASGGFNSLEDAFAQFRQRPERASFDAIQQQCGALLTVFDKVPAVKAIGDAKGVRCDPSIVGEPVARILALNDGLAAYKARCAKPESLPQTSVDDLLTFGQQCLASSGLGGQDTVAFRSQINSIGLNRDDKAHRFVVSWNAFLDGNRLAYLALLIAIALDGLVFMSGLFGANATSSPLVRLPSASRRSASDLEATMYAALRPDIYGRAKLVINALHPIQAHDGFVSEIRLGDYDREAAAAIRSVLSMAGQFGAVQPDPRQSDVYMVRGELTEFLSKACERELRINPKVQEAAEAARIIEARRHVEYEQERQGKLVSERDHGAKELQEDRDLRRRSKALEELMRFPLSLNDAGDGQSVARNTEKFIAQLRPTKAVDGHTHVLDLNDIAEQDLPLYLGILNAAATVGAAQPASDAGNGDVYLLRPEVLRSLQSIGRDAVERARQSVGKPNILRRLLLRDSTADARAREQAGGSEPARITDARANATAAVPAISPPIDNVFPIAASGSLSGQKFSSPAVVHRQNPPATRYLDRLKQELESGEDRQTLDVILRNDWSNALDGNFSHLSANVEMSRILRQATASAMQLLSEFDQTNGESFGATGTAENEAVRDAFLGLNQLTFLHAYLQERSATQAHDTLLTALEGLMQDRPNAMQGFEKAVALFDDTSARVRIARGEMN